MGHFSSLDTLAMRLGVCVWCLASEALIVYTTMNNENSRSNLGGRIPFASLIKMPLCFFFVEIFGLYGWRR